MKYRGRNPTEKKALSYERDARLQYGKNNTTARKAVRVRKADNHRSYRRSVNQILSGVDVEAIEDRASNIKRKRWRKISDARLIQHLDNTWSSSSRTGNQIRYDCSPARKLALLKLRRKRGQYS